MSFYALKMKHMSVYQKTDSIELMPENVLSPNKNSTGGSCSGSRWFRVNGCTI